MNFLSTRTEPSQEIEDPEKTDFFDKFSTRELDDNFTTKRCWISRRHVNEKIGHVTRQVVIASGFGSEKCVDKFYNTFTIELDKPIYLPSDATYGKFSCVLSKFDGLRYGIKTKQDLVTYHHYNNTMERRSEKEYQDTTLVLQQVESVL